MANAIKKISVQRGYDVTRYALNCFGGAQGCPRNDDRALRARKHVQEFVVLEGSCHGRSVGLLGLRRGGTGAASSHAPSGPAWPSPPRVPPTADVPAASRERGSRRTISVPRRYPREPRDGGQPPQPFIPACVPEAHRCSLRTLSKRPPGSDAPFADDFSTDALETPRAGNRARSAMTSLLTAQRALEGGDGPRKTVPALSRVC
jgi:hypothetical protein